VFTRVGLYILKGQHSCDLRKLDFICVSLHGLEQLKSFKGFVHVFGVFYNDSALAVDCSLYVYRLFEAKRNHRMSLVTFIVNFTARAIINNIYKHICLA